MQLSTGVGAYVKKPQGAAKGGVVVIQEIFGVNAHIRNVADRFAEAGYVAIAPCVFDHIEPGIELGYDQAGMSRGVECIKQLGLDTPMQDIQAAAEAIADAGKVGTVGYCWGGTLAMLAAQRLGLPSSSYYGARNVPFLNQPFKARVQFHFGEKDHGIPPEMVQQHRDALPEMELYTYPAEHGFNCDQRASYDADSAALAWQRTLDFFARELA